MKIITILSYACNTYLIKGTTGKNVLIDAGAFLRANDFLSILNKNNITPQSIPLIIITHAHWDHIASIPQLKNLTNAKVLIHEKEKELLEKGLKPMPKAFSLQSKFTRFTLGFIKYFVKIKPIKPDIIINNEIFSLEKYGIKGYIIHTPGHTKGSLSVILKSGEAFVGDLLMNGFPLRKGPGLAVFGDSINEIKDSVELLKKHNITTIYPAHGKPFNINDIRY